MSLSPNKDEKRKGFQFLSKALFSNQTVARRVFLAFLIPVLFHGFYNVFITYSTALAVILLLVGFISVFILYRRLRKIQSIKFDEAETKYEISARNIFTSIFAIPRMQSRARTILLR